MAYQYGSWITWHEAVICLSSFCICWLLQALSKFFPVLSGSRDQLRAVQASHTRPTPRIGGVAIFATLIIGLFFVPLDAVSAYQKFVLSVGFLFCVGLAEDLGFGIPPHWRLMAALTASLLVIFFLGVWMPRSDIPFLDSFIGHWSVGIPVTLFVTAGIANGFNLIDGVNGLAGLTAIIAAIALACIASDANDMLMLQLSLMFASGVAGFLIWNYPGGKIFLGDAGAYSLGFVLSWFAIAILVHSPSASPWALLLTLFWPVADTLLAIWRRAHRKAPTMAPDRLHVHQLVMRSLEIYFLGRGRRHVTNPMTTLLLAPFIVAPPIAGVLLWDNTGGAFLAVVTFTVMFFGAYTLAFSVLNHLPRCLHKSSAELADDEFLGRLPRGPGPTESHMPSPKNKALANSPDAPEQDRASSYKMGH